jgi:hypothetical protein
MNNGKVINLFGYEVVEYVWETAVREIRTNKWITISLRPDGRTISVEGIDIEIHENGIEFL